MERSNYPVIPCETCGKLFRPARPDQGRCRQCADMPESAEELPRVAIPFFDQAEGDATFRKPDPGNPCKRCGAPAPAGDRLCALCREALRLSLSRAALEMSRKMLDQRKRRQEMTLDIRPLLEQKLERAARTSISTEYLPVKRF